MKISKSLLSLGLVGALVASSVGVGAAGVDTVEVKSPNFKVTGTYTIEKPVGNLFGEKLRGGSLITGKAYKYDTIIGTVRVGDAKSFYDTKYTISGNTLFFSGVGIKPGKQYLIQSGERGTSKLGVVVADDKRLVGKKFSYKRSGKGYMVAIDGVNMKMDPSDRVLAGNTFLMRKDLVPVPPKPVVKKPAITKPVVKQPVIKQPSKPGIGIPKPAPIVKK